MRRMSFALTTEQVKNQTKTVTRRKNWKNLQPGDLIQPVVKCMGLKKGEKQQLLGCPIEVINVGFEPLYLITKEDLIKEGFPTMSKEDFIALYLKANGGESDHCTTRIEFKYTKKLTMDKVYTCQHCGGYSDEEEKFQTDLDAGLTDDLTCEDCYDNFDLNMADDE